MNARFRLIGTVCLLSLFACAILAQDRPGQDRLPRKPRGLYHGGLLISPGDHEPPPISDQDLAVIRRVFGAASLKNDQSEVPSPHIRRDFPQCLVLLRVHADPRIRSVAALTLAVSVTEPDLVPQARDALKKASKDKHPLVREKAAWSLKWIDEQRKQF